MNNVLGIRARYNQESVSACLERDTESELARQLIAGETGAFDRFVDYFRAEDFPL